MDLNLSNTIMSDVGIKEVKPTLAAHKIFFSRRIPKIKAGIDWLPKRIINYELED